MNLMVIYSKYTALDISQSQGIDQEVVSNLKGLLREAGFVSIKHGFASLPVGKWGDSDTKVGEMMRENYRKGLVAVKHFMASQLGMTPKQYDEYCDACAAEYDERQSYANVYWAYAQRPVWTCEQVYNSLNIKADFLNVAR